jgi:YkoY family integral membrane protein
MLEESVDRLVDSGVQTPLILLILIVLEAVLSADNAIALAAIAQNLKDPKLQRQALNIGLVGAYVLRMTLILTATWVVQFWQFELIGAFYLLWLVFDHFTSSEEENLAEESTDGSDTVTLWQIVPTIAMTDLAFSLDSVTTAIAVAEDTWLIVVGGTIGIITLRFLAELFIRWLKEYVHLEDAGFITVGFVGLRLLFKVILPELMIPEWVTIVVIFVLFTWGFSEREVENS